MAFVAGSPEATPWAKDPSVASFAFCTALHAAVGTSSAPAPAVSAPRTKARRSIGSFMATPSTRWRPDASAIHRFVTRRCAAARCHDTPDRGDSRAMTDGGGQQGGGWKLDWQTLLAIVGAAAALGVWINVVGGAVLWAR